MTCTSLDFSMALAPPNFNWGGRKTKRVVILSWPDGTLCVPVIRYLAYRAMYERSAMKSRKQEAYILRDWLTFLANRRRDYRQVADNDLHEWHQHMTDYGLTARRIEVKLTVVFRFYRLLPRAMPYDLNGNKTKTYVNPATQENDGSFPISGNEFTFDDKKVFRWSGSEPQHVPETDPRVIDETAVRMVLNAMRFPRTSSIDGDAQSLVGYVRNWCIGRTMVDGGLRAVEIPELSLPHLTAGLRQEGLLECLAAFGLERIPCISQLAENRPARDALIDAIGRFATIRKRKYIMVKIFGKGSKERFAPFTIRLVIDLLEHYIWGPRHDLIKRKANSSFRGINENAVFLSELNGNPLQPGSVSDIARQGFVDAGVQGSGHDLRKHYATKMAEIILEETLHTFRYQLTPAVTNTVLERVRRALGHSKVNTTTLYYVDMAKMHYMGIRDSSKRNVANTLWNVLADKYQKLSDRRLRLIGTFINSLSEVDDESLLVQMAEKMVVDRRVNPIEPPDFRKEPILRLVASDKIGPAT